MLHTVNPIRGKNVHAVCSSEENYFEGSGVEKGGANKATARRGPIGWQRLQEATPREAAAAFSEAPPAASRLGLMSPFAVLQSVGMEGW